MGLNIAIADLVKALANELGSRKYKLAPAESCTGGWIAKVCTDEPGSSAWFEQGYVCYSNQSKQSLLNVSATTLENYGAVSKQVAEEMASGVLQHSLADISIAVTGIAGPDGGSEEKPVGTVWIAWGIKKEFHITSEKFLFDGDRGSVRQQAVTAALAGTLELLKKY